MKVCTQCGCRKPPSEFHRDASKADGRRPDCKPCARARVRRYYKANAERLREQGRLIYRSDPAKRARINESTRRCKLMRKYGLTIEEYEAIIARGCAICGASEGIQIDHDHSTGKVRDGLCGACNRALGCVEDDPERLRRAADYLDQHRVVV